MLRERKLLIYGLLLIAVGIGSYFFSPQKEYDENANYELSRAKGGNWQSTTITGKDLNQQTKDAQGMNAVTSTAIVGLGCLVLGFEWWRSRR